MEDKKPDQIKMEFSTDTEKIVKEEPAPKTKASSKRKKKSNIEPKTISIIDDLYDEDGDRLAPPKKDVFEKYSDHFHGSDEEQQLNFDKKFIDFESGASVKYDIDEKSDSVIVINDQNEQISAEIETLQGNVHSDSYEYTSRQQRKEIIGMYKYAKHNVKTKIILVSILTIILFLIENANALLVTPIAFFSNPYILTSANIIVFLVCVFLAHEQLYYGIKSISSKDYIPEAIAVVSVICALIHSLLMLLFIVFDNEPKLYNFPVALTLVMVLLYSYINVAREKYGFGIVSSKEIKHYLEKASQSDDESETETFSSSLDEFEGEISRVKRTAFVSGYFANTNMPPKLRSYLSVYLTFSLFAPAILAIISLFNAYDFFSAISIWYIGVLFMLPVGILFSYSVPFLKGNKYLYDSETAIIGENAISEFASIDVASVNDTTAFPPYNVKLKYLKVFNNFKTEKVLFYAASGFSVVGGPLADVFGCATRDAFKKSTNARFSCAGKDYFCVNIDGDTVIFADRIGMSSRGIDVGSASENESDDSVLYMACNGSLCAKMYINYQFDDGFLDIVEGVNKSKVSVGIRTFDPNINQALIDELTNGRKIDLRVIRLIYEESIPVVTSKSEGKIVSRGQSKHLLKAIPVCKKIVNIRKVTRAIKILSSIAGSVLVGLSIFGLFSLISSTFIAVYQVSIIILMAIITALVMPKSK